MVELWQTLEQLACTLGTLVVVLLGLLLHWSLLIAWLAWALGAINWEKTWPVLAQGAWVPAFLILVVAALVWSQMFPTEGNFLGLTTVPNFWWQLGEVGLIAALTLFCGWLQGIFGWTPAEIELQPPPGPVAHGHP